MQVSLGDFRLGELLGQGGMGEVWGATHGPTGLDVAIKVVTLERARGARFHDSFRTEVQAMARLHHESIAVVLDYGRVLPAAHEASGGHLAVDAPYLVMERCEDSLARRASAIDSWPVACSVLMQLLDALAHAHARFVIHRDLKPQNVLVSPTDDGLLCKLADFGLAQPFDDPDDSPKSSGTPKYMAPEQIVGSFRDQGPWTDLYALGCLARWLVMGESPFESENSEAVLRGHLFEEPPPLEPRFALPEGYEEWLGLLLEKDPARRLARAADARHLLERLDGAASTPLPIRPMRNSNDRHRESAPTIVSDGSEGRTPLQEQTRQAFLDQVASVRSVRKVFAPPQRATWRRLSAPSRPMPLVGAGISLYGLRPVPLVAREAERDAIWSDLAGVAVTGEPHVVVLRGAAGSGKSRLAQWMGERAEEFGAARVIRAGHSQLGGSSDGVGRMVGSYLRAVGLDRRSLVRRFEQFMSPDGAGREFDVVDVLALADLVQGGTGWSRTATVRERNSVLLRFLARAAWDRPLYLWIDDAQWGRDALDLANAVASSEVPALVVLTVRDEALIDRPLERASLQALAETAPHYREVPIGALSESGQRELIQGMLRLDADVARDLAARTEGNPLFAVQLVGDWVERGLLVPGDDGFELEEPEAASLPDSIHNLWSRRISRAIARYVERSSSAVPTSGSSSEAEWALWGAAVLGQEVDFAEWSKVCTALGVEPSHRLVEELVRMKLAERTATGFRFSHGMLGESLMRRAEDEGNTAALHRAAAVVLQAQPDRRNALRLAQHYLAADDPLSALEPLLIAAEELTRRGDFVAALDVDDRRFAILDEFDIDPSSFLRIEGWTRRARTHLLAGDYELADADIASAADALEQKHDPRAEVQILWTRVIRARHQNETTEGAALAAQLLGLFSNLDDRLGMARTRNKLGEFHRRLGDLPRSIEHYDHARDRFDRLDEPFELAWSFLGLGTSQRHARQVAPARENIGRALALFTTVSSRIGLGNCHNELGELERAAGNFAEAEAHYREAIQLWGQSGHTELSLIEYNVALTLIAREQWGEATEIVERVLTSARERGHRAIEMLCYVAIACCRVGSLEPDFEAEFESFERLHAEIDLIEPDIAELALVFGTLCIPTRPDLSQRSLRIAADVFGLLEDERVAVVQGLLAQIDTH